MAQQSARRGRKNQGFPPWHEHAVGDVVPVRELPYGPAAQLHDRPGRWQHPTTCQNLNKPLATEGAPTEEQSGQADFARHRRSSDPPLDPAAFITSNNFRIVLTNLLSSIAIIDDQNSNGGRDDNKLRILKHALAWNIATP